MNRTQTTYTMDYGDDYDPRTTELRARWHEEHRQRTIILLLTEFYLMSVADVFPDSFTIEFTGAHWQDAFGDAVKGTQAAHCVPCQIKMSGRHPQQYLRKHSPDRAEIIEAYFGKTDTLPAIFNKCDSQAEPNGLKEAFLEATFFAIESGRSGGTFHLSSVSAYVRKAFKIYLDFAKIAFKKTIEHFEKKQNQSNISQDEKKQALKQIKIVEFYKSEVRYSTALNDSLKLGEIVDSIDFYKNLK
jgi:hypothetical protein